MSGQGRGRLNGVEGVGDLQLQDCVVHLRRAVCVTLSVGSEVGASLALSLVKTLVQAINDQPTSGGPAALISSAMVP